MAIKVDAAFPVFFDATGAPVDGGFVYVGTANLDPVTNQQAVYWDEAMTIQATQPLRTIGGRIARNGAPALLFVSAEYSIEVQDSNMQAVYTADAVPLLGWPDLDQGPGSSSFFSNGAAPVNPFARLRGRAFFGLSSGHDGSTDDGSPNPTGSWLQSYASTGALNPVTAWDYAEDTARVSSVSDFGIAGGFATRNNGIAGIAVAGFANGEYPTHTVWGGYFDGVRNNASGKNAFGVEIEAAQLPAAGSMGGMTPYRNYTNTMAIPAQIGSGSDETVFGRSYATEAFINCVENGAAAWTGINFRFDAIMREGMTDDTTKPENEGYARAVSMAHEQGLSWYSRDPATTGGTQQEAARIYSTVNSSSIRYEVVFDDGAMSVNEQESPGSSLFRVKYLSNGDAFVQVTPAALGASPSIEPGGTNADIDLTLTPKGTGSIRIPIAKVVEYADDVAAAAGGVSVGGIYRTGSNLKIRVS